MDQLSHEKHLRLKQFVDLKPGQFIIVTSWDEFDNYPEIECLLCVKRSFNAWMAYKEYEDEEVFNTQYEEHEEDKIFRFWDYLLERGYVEKISHKEMDVQRNFYRKGRYHPDTYSIE